MILEDYTDNEIIWIAENLIMENYEGIQVFINKKKGVKQNG